MAFFKAGFRRTGFPAGFAFVEWGVAFFVSELSKNENITSEVKPKEKKSLPTILSNLREKIETYLNRKFSKLQKQPKISEEEDDNE